MGCENEVKKIHSEKMSNKPWWEALVVIAAIAFIAILFSRIF